MTSWIDISWKKWRQNQHHIVDKGAQMSTKSSCSSSSFNKTLPVMDGVKETRGRCKEERERRRKRTLTMTMMTVRFEAVAERYNQTIASTTFFFSSLLSVSHVSRQSSEAKVLAQINCQVGPTNRPEAACLLRARDEVMLLLLSRHSSSFLLNGRGRRKWGTYK